MQDNILTGSRDLDVETLGAIHLPATLCKYTTGKPSTTIESTLDI